MKTIKITNESEYDAAVTRMDQLWGAELGSPEGDELDELLDALYDYDYWRRSSGPIGILVDGDDGKNSNVRVWVFDPILPE